MLKMAYSTGKKLIESRFSPFFQVVGISEKGDFMYLHTTLNTTLIDAVCSTLHRV